MKILIISPTSSGIGGIAQHVTGLTNYLKRQGHNVEIISSENTFTIPIKGLKNPSFIISSFLKSKLKKGFDIVHAHNIPSAYAMKNFSCKKVLSLHGIYSKQINQLHGKITTTISEKLEYDSLKHADVITTISKDTKDYYSNLGFKTIQIPNAIDIQSLSKDKDKRFKKQLIFVGRLSKEKGIETLVQISKKLPSNIDILIIGSGPDQEKIKILSESKPNIHFLGYQNHEKTIQLIRGSDILIQPSLVEGISTTLLEAMACKTPVIATNVGGTSELITHKKTGILIQPNNPDEFLVSINDLFNNSDFTKMTEDAYQKVQNYDWSIIGKQYLNLYMSII